MNENDELYESRIKNYGASVKCFGSYVKDDSYVKDESVANHEHDVLSVHF